jgi:predicted restriction endonuclease
MTKEIENRILILYAIQKLNGKASKKDVLDYIFHNSLIKLTETDREILSSRKEEKWRNTLAYTRDHLVHEKYLNNKEKNQWEITEEGINYYQKLISDLDKEKSVRIADYDLIKRNEITDNELLNSEEYIELFLDDKEYKNESVTRQIDLIKRYKGIVGKIKLKYNYECQISNCNFTFTKKDGEKYSEGHHLIPLSEGGSQKEDNLVILCPNHHKMFHYANIEVKDKSGDKRIININGIEYIIKYK